MKIDFEHLGGIDKGSIELNDITLFCGRNNSGKTYVMYCLYGLLNKKFNISFDLNFYLTRGGLRGAQPPFNTSKIIS